MSEQWECLDCLAHGSLDTHGRCGSCHSDSVVPIALLISGREAELERDRR